MVTRRRKALAAGLAAALGFSLLPLIAVPAQAAPVGQGFELNAGDLRFILRQIKIAENHATKEGPGGEPVAGQPLFGPGPNQIGNALLPYGLRTVDGSDNNGIPGQSAYGAVANTFPRHAAPQWRPGEDATGFGGPANSSYSQKKGVVADSEPRVISNLIVDQSSTNPAAVVAAGKPHRSFNQDPTAVPCVVEPDPGPPPTEGSPPGCTPRGETLFIPNVTTDFGLSAPYNSWFALFGQFFDHGVDLTAKGGSGSVIVPLQADDPLIPGPDGELGTTDDLPPNMRFMVVTRAKNQPGPDGHVGDNPNTPTDESADDVQEATNLDSSWVDQSQTYASHSSHQVFLRQYKNNSAGKPVATGRMLDGPNGGMGTWATVKDQAASLLGIRLTDVDVLNVPMVAADQYGRFLRGPNGYPQLVTASGLVEGNPAAPIAIPANVSRINIAFLDDIAHHAVPSVAKTPDADTVINPPGTQLPADQYDNEMLDAHFVAGDGRVNENIGLVAVHQVFHSEHNRLVGYIKNLIIEESIDVPEWQSPTGADGWNGERLFQAARFVTEMEYQHIVFEDFARKVQPGINPFNVFTQSDTGINPDVRAEFAHAVYRFGHSMLTDTVARTNENGTRSDVPLLDAFLNPPAYYRNGSGGTYTAAQAAGAIAQGMTEQTGNELDEFVTGALRNNLLGLPLDLAAVNMTRARDAGVPSLNNFRKQVYAQTNDSALQPYTDWVDFGLSIKHPESVINFMAAYGTHPRILTDAGPDHIVEDDPATTVDESADNRPATLASRRKAARLIYENDAAVHPVPETPADSADFVNSIGAWANTADGGSRTGVDDIDLWVGGLAESQVFFGGLLGSTFNYVFERQLTDLQDGDRLYYLSRTSGLNLRTELEGNTMAELTMRNTTAQALKADVFATSDCKFDLNRPTFAGTGNTIADDPESECDESKVLIRMADGTIRYRQSNSVDPPGLNAQSTYNGTPGNDRMWGGIDNDTFWGNDGNDRVEGNDGADEALGGLGDDIITDSAGDDVHKGGAGNDAIDAGPGLDIIIGGDGKDFTNGGLNANQTFAGEGDDFVIAGDGPDTVFGGGGDDWQEGGNSNDLLQGDSGAPFFDDINAPGHDVLIGNSGEDDYDAEGGDDIMVAGPGIERNHGVRGFDFAIHARSAEAADSDLTIAIADAPIMLADRFLLTEALSGWDKDDVLKGDDVVPLAQDLELNTPWGSNVLTEEGIDRIQGLRPLLAGRTACVASPPDVSPSAAVCGFGGGNILIGGGGSDEITGRGADDIIDGDAWLNVRLSVRTNPADPTTEIGTANSLNDRYLRDAAGDPTGQTLHQAVFSGALNPHNIVIVREILHTGPAGVDTAVFSGPRADYDIIPNADGSLTVVHARNVPPPGDQGGAGGDGTDTLRNIERLEFTDTTVTMLTPGAPAIGTADAGNESATVTWSAPADNGGPAISGYLVRVVDAAGDQVGEPRTAPADVTRLLVTGLTNGQTYRFQVAAVNELGTGAYSALSNEVTPFLDVTAPTVTVERPLPDATSVARAGNIQGLFSEVVNRVNANTVQLRDTATNALVPAAVTYNRQTGRFTLNPDATLAPDKTYRVTLTSAITDVAGNALAPTSWTFTTGPAPQVTARTPEPGATTVPRTGNITVTFNEAVTGVSTAAVQLKRVSNGNVLVTRVSYDSATRVLTIDPNVELHANVEYEVTLIGGPTALRDLAGNPLPTTSWTFTTGS